MVAFIDLVVIYLYTSLLQQLLQVVGMRWKRLTFDLRLSFPLPQQNASRLLEVWYPQYNFSGPVSR